MTDPSPEVVGVALALTFFGPFEVRLAGQPLPPLRSRRGYQLLALLALRSPREVERTWLAAMLWPDSDEDRAAANLRNTLKDLRQALGEEAGRLRSPSSRTLTLELSGAAVDVVAFDQAIAQGDPASLERAVALYRGPLLEGWAEEWVFQERQAREECYMKALECLAARAMGEGGAGEAARWLRLAIAADPLRENAHRDLMQALAAQGNYAAATRTYWDLRLLLHREMNLEPAPETTGLFEQIRAEARRRARTEVGRRPSALEPVVRMRSSSSTSPPAAEDAPPHPLPEGMNSIP